MHIAKFFIYLSLFTFYFCLSSSNASRIEKPAFNIIPLGTSGGELENNLSSYLVAPVHSNDWVALDAGTLCGGIKNIPKSTLKTLGIVSAKKLFSDNIKAYLLTHAHLDHISGLIICSTGDSNKTIIGLPSTIEHLKNHIFNWKLWPNFANEGQEPLLKKYQYHRLELNHSNSIAKTRFTVTAYPLSHGNNYESTAFLLESNHQYLLYLGDTGADAMEHSHDLQHVWQVIAPLIKKHQLHAIFIECSYSNSQPDNMLFGHLTPKWLLRELDELAKQVDSQHRNTALQGLTVVVTHIKQGLEETQNKNIILNTLNNKNRWGVIFKLPQPNVLLTL
ncbi:MAG: 3',5'-cyclic-nucleotide phosphodiesterase [bacterium]|nr:3',5'-cyclic-nucleotide phosphodiesterase [bacterium]